MPLPPLFIKASAGLAVVSTVSLGSIYFGTDLLKSKRTVSELIKDLKKDKRLITSSLVSDPDWKAAGKKYRTDNNSKDVDVGSVNGWSKVNGEITDANAPQDFIDKCRNRSAQKVLNEKDDLYSQVISYCTRATLVSDLINETEGKTLLTKGNDFATNSDGKAIGDPYKSANQSLGQDSGNIGNGSSNKNSTNVPTEFVDKCEKQSKIEEYRFDQSSYLEVLKYCTK